MKKKSSRKNKKAKKDKRGTKRSESPPLMIADLFNAFEASFIAGVAKIVEVCDEIKKSEGDR